MLRNCTPTLFTICEASEFIGVSKSTVKKWINDGQLDVVWISGKAFVELTKEIGNKRLVEGGDL